MSKHSFFEMKQMRIEQNDCAMKVSTDACIQGAWTPIATNCGSVLDIGTGTGLLSLMIAQRCKNAKIDAVEIDTEAAAQATLNVANSIFAQQIKVTQQDVCTWQNNKQYDLIVCNPPFFSNSLRSENEQRRLARHNDFLSPQNLAIVLSRYLNQKGAASVLLPTSEQLRFETAFAANNLYCSKRLFIKPFEHTLPNRIIYYLQKNVAAIQNEENLIIYAKEKSYTEDFILLMKDFYLHL